MTPSQAPEPIAAEVAVAAAAVEAMAAHAGRARRIPFLEMIGSRITQEADGVAVIELALRPDLLNNHGGGHGGVVMSLLDSAMANAALSKLDYSREVVTIDMQIAFMRPAVGRLKATGRAVGGGRSICFCEAVIEDETGQVTAKSMGTFRYRTPGPSHAGE